MRVAGGNANDASLAGRTCDVAECGDASGSVMGKQEVREQSNELM